MNTGKISMCGDQCDGCTWKEKTGCRGCHHHRGQMFFGTCDVAVCCSSKHLAHCGYCPDVPCEILKQVFDHPEHGDNGERLANLKARAKGNDTIIEIGGWGKDRNPPADT